MPCSGLASNVGSEQQRTGLLVPLYIYPNADAWRPLIDAKKACPGVPVVAVVNPALGPGDRTDPNYATGIGALRDAGIMVYAYLPTRYTTRQYGDMVAEIDRYAALYGRSFDGLFYDQMARTGEGYYRVVTTYAKEHGFPQVIGKAGTDVPKSYIGRSADVVVVYEDPGNPSPQFLDRWRYGFPKESWALIAHHVPELDPALVAHAKEKVGLLYFTDADYRTLPPYLGRLLELL